MQVCTVDMELADGSLCSVAFASSVSAMKLAESIRSDGEYGGKAVKRGMVRASWQTFPHFEFVVTTQPKKSTGKQK